MGRPVFRVEDTDGQPLEYERIELPELPLMEKATEWRISVKAVLGLILAQCPGEPATDQELW